MSIERAAGDPEDPHRGQPVLTVGRPLAEAAAAVVLVHGRGASAADILTLVPELDRPDLAYLAPQAADHTWYPYSFLSPLEQNEPWLSSALALLADTLQRIADGGIAAEKTVLLGFSQGACLSLEFAARNPRRYGGVIAFSGGLIGPSGMQRGGFTGPDEPGPLAGTPVLLGCSDRDPHVPVLRVEESAQILATLGADVTARIFPGLEHTINDEELELARGLLAALTE